MTPPWDEEADRALEYTVNIPVGLPVGAGGPWPLTGLINRYWMDDSHVSGGSIIDDIGGLNTSSIGTGITSTAGPAGATYATARAFDGTTNATAEIVTPIGITFDGAHAFSWASWVNLTNNTLTMGGNRVAFFSQYITSLIFVRILNDTAIGAGTFGVSVGATAAGLASPVGAIPNTTWTHCCFTFDGASTSAIYVNGAAQSTVAETSSGSGVSVNTIGALDTTPSGAITGAMYGMGFWSRALTSLEVTQLYNAR